MSTDRTRRPGARVYEGENIAVSYEAGRCLHAAECVRGLHEVFDTRRRPWIAPDAAPADLVAEVIHRCPSGALQYHRLDGGADETPETPTSVKRHDDGVIHVRGDLKIDTPEGVTHETRVMLCGCGLTKREPFCDHSGRCGEHGG